MSWMCQYGGRQQERCHISDFTGRATSAFIARKDADGWQLFELVPGEHEGRPAMHMVKRASGLSDDVIGYSYDPELPGVVVRVGDHEIGMVDREWP